MLALVGTLEMCNDMKLRQYIAGPADSQMCIEPILRKLSKSKTDKPNFISLALKVIYETQFANQPNSLKQGNLLGGF